MLLSQYLALTRSLIQTPQSPIPLIPDALLTQDINLARRQIAAQAECIPAQGTLAVDPSSQQYPFSAITFPAASGIAAAINVRTMTWGMAGLPGRKPMFVYNWPRFNSFILAQPVPASGQPRYWAEYGTGTSGSVYVNQLDGSYTLHIDAIGLPVALADDSTPDAIPALWEDAVPFYAAFYAFMQLQRQADADLMLQRFQALMGRAQGGATPSVQSGAFPGGGDPVAANRLGMQNRQGGAPARQPIATQRGTGPEV